MSCYGYNLALYSFSGVVVTWPKTTNENENTFYFFILPKTVIENESIFYFFFIFFYYSFIYLFFMLVFWCNGFPNGFFYYYLSAFFYMEYLIYLFFIFTIQFVTFEYTVFNKNLFSNVHHNVQSKFTWNCSTGKKMPRAFNLLGPKNIYIIQSVSWKSRDVFCD